MPKYYYISNKIRTLSGGIKTITWKIYCISFNEPTRFNLVKIKEIGGILNVLSPIAFWKIQDQSQCMVIL